MSEISVQIFTEGGKQFGAGHVSRCVALYQAFTNLNRDTQLVINGDDSVSFAWHPEKPVFLDWQIHDAEDADIIIIDSYTANELVYRKYREKCKMLVVFDDFNRLDYPAHLIINAAGNDETYSNFKGILLKGLTYASLKRPFWEAKKSHHNKDIQKILLSLGGGATVTTEFVRRLVIQVKKMFDAASVGVIGDYDALDLPEVRQANRLTAEQIGEEMQTSDFAIVGGGQTLLEAIAVGLPTISILIAENQANNINQLHQNEATLYAGPIKDNHFSLNINRQLQLIKSKNKREELTEKGRSIIDGKGSIRMARSILYHFAVQEVQLRKATGQDAQEVYNLSNEPEVRKISLNQKVIDFQEHLQWYNKKIKETSHLFLIARINDNFVGQIRFKIFDNHATISISIAKEYRAFGLGKIIFNQSLTYLLADYPKVSEILAQVKKDNTPSVKYFNSLHFVLHREVEINNTKVLEFKHIIKNGI